MIKEFHVSENLCPTAWEQGSIDSTTGNDTQSNSEIRSDYISVFPNGVFSIKRTIDTAYVKIRLYDSSKNYLGTGTDNTTLIYGGQGSTAGNPMQANQDFCCVQIVNPNAYYMRIVDTSNDLSTLYMFTEGNYTPSTMIPFEPYGNTWNTKSYAKSITGAQTYTKFPIVLRTTEQSIPTWSMDGNVETSGTPSPSSPITINGCGDRTANLFDVNNATLQKYITSDGSITDNVNYAITDYLPIEPSTKYSLSGISDQPSTAYHAYYDTTKNLISTVQASNLQQTLNTPANAAYIRCSWRIASSLDIMMNVGDTLLPYEPYGYEISVVSNSTTLSPIYLSEQLMKIGDTADSLASTGTATYNIKKLVLTGGDSESWNSYSLGTANAFFILQNISMGNATVMSSHFAQTGIYTTNTAVGIDTSGTTIRFRPPNVATDFATTAAWKQYLADQYAAGTPVTVYYILATATTETVTALSIPTTSGLNTIDVNTTVKPSEMSLTYNGYKICKHKRKSENLFDGTMTQGGIYDIGIINTMTTRVRTQVLVSAGKKYTISSNMRIRTVYGYNGDYNDPDNRVELIGSLNKPQTYTFTVPEGVTNVGIAFCKADDSDILPSEIKDVMINEGQTALPYEPYWE